MARTAKLTIRIQDEGGDVSVFDTLNFVGAGVSASNAGGGVATISIPGGASSFTVLTPSSGFVNSSNLVFVFASAPTYILADGVFLQKLDANGIPQWSGTTTVTMVNPPATSLLGIQ